MIRHTIHMSELKQEPRGWRVLTYTLEGDLAGSGVGGCRWAMEAGLGTVRDDLGLLALSGSDAQR